MYASFFITRSRVEHKVSNNKRFAFVGLLIISLRPTDAVGSKSLVVSIYSSIRFLLRFWRFRPPVSVFGGAFSIRLVEYLLNAGGVWIQRIELQIDWKEKLVNEDFLFKL